MDYQQKYLNIVKEKILELTDGMDVTVFLFGSRAREDSLQGSDIDIGFEGIVAEDFLRVRRAFNLFHEESIVPSRVDLVNFAGVNEGFSKEVKKDAIVWKTGLTIEVNN